VNNIITIKKQIEACQNNWLIPFMDFVDEFRYYRDISIISIPIQKTNERLDAILASTIEFLCNEQQLNTPDWVWDIPGCRYPWFVSGVESIKAITIVQSPVYFRRRKIFVLENFLSRV